MPSHTVERKLAAILSADVVGYSRLISEDEAGTIRTLTAYREEIAMLVRQHPELNPELTPKSVDSCAGLASVSEGMR